MWADGSPAHDDQLRGQFLAPDVGTMKRSPELRDLSEEHHYGLVASRQLRLAAAGSDELEQPTAAFLRTWREEIEPHFRTEEAVLLPGLAEATGVQTSLIDRTLAEHAALRVAVLELAAAPAGDRQFLATRAAELLHDHIRFEERVLFPEIERLLEGEALRHLGNALKHQMTASGAARSHSCGISEPGPTPEEVVFGQ